MENNMENNITNSYTDLNEVRKKLQIRGFKVKNVTENNVSYYYPHSSNDDFTVTLSTFNYCIRYVTRHQDCILINGLTKIDSLEKSIDFVLDLIK